jgi:hypothetical protein
MLVILTRSTPSSILPCKTGMLFSRLSILVYISQISYKLILRKFYYYLQYFCVNRVFKLLVKESMQPRPQTIQESLRATNFILLTYLSTYLLNERFVIWLAHHYNHYHL